MDEFKEFLRQYFTGLGGDPFTSHRGVSDDPITLSERKKRFTLSKLSQDSSKSLFEQSTKTIIDNEGTKVIETSTAYIAGCGHLVGLNDQNLPSGFCSVCKQLVCSQCSSVRCHK